MKVSEITVNDVVEYLKLETGEYEESHMQVLLDIATSFIKSYTGIKDKIIVNEAIGIGDGETKEFSLKNSAVIDSTIQVSIDGTIKEKNTDYKLDFGVGKIEFVTAPIKGGVITASYNTGIDAFEEFTAVVYILCQDMHDNRTMYVDKANINKVYQSILDMHCVNLL